MKTNDTPDLTLIQIIDRFPTDEAARQELESIRWKDGIVCPHCKCSDQSKFSGIAANKEKKVRAGLRWCAACEKQFTVTIGTIFEDSHIPLRKWLIAWYLICSSKKGVSSLQLQRQLELGSYRTALFMTHRIRFALQDPVFKGSLKGTVEVDETYVGGKPRKGTGIHKRGRGTSKVPVVTVLERGGRARSQVVRPVTGKNLKAVLQKHVSPYATIMTDEYTPYRDAAKGFTNHQTVNHSAGEYVRGPWHTNSVEGFFSLLKRGVVGTFHHISEKYLPLYLAEFDHRHNFRNVSDGERTLAGLQKMTGKRLKW
ncbi:MAG TPA: IS1595 family transposase [Verrucomicrobiae bacterium]|nr:IS1595 family transposase [Verrucomicrobiae bacterium]